MPTPMESRYFYHGLLGSIVRLRRTLGQVNYTQLVIAARAAEVVLRP